MDVLRAITTPEGFFEIPFSEESLIRAEVTSEANASQCVRVYSCWLTLLADSPLNATVGRKPRKVFAKFSRWLFSRPVKDTILLMASLADEIMGSCTLFGSGSVTGDFVPAMSDTPIFMEYQHWRRTGDAELLRYVLTFLLFPKKAEFVDDSLQSDALRKWLAVEERVNNVSVGELGRPLHRLLSMFLQQPKTVKFLPKHGPGTVMDGRRDISSKVKQLEYDPHIDRVFFQTFFTEEDRLGYDPHWALPEPERWIKARSKYKSNLHQRFERRSELLFVPKDIKSLRTICRETTTSMFFQQDVSLVLRQCIGSGLIGQTLTIEDQEPSRQLCIEGSTYGSVDTIDLSSASDSVSWQLVRAIFPKWIIPRLQATRSSVVRMPDKRWFAVGKFAPMGSAVCFPVQCLVYWSVVASKYLERDFGDDWWQVLDDKTITDFLFRIKGIEGDPPKGRPAPFRIYGDDIICDTHVTDSVVHLLTNLGFEVNTGKSFTSSQAFRESCGMYAWNGKNVTPLRYQVKRTQSSRLDMESAASLVELANRAGDYKYVTLRRWIIRHVLCTPISGVKIREGEINPIPFVGTHDEWGFYQPHGLRNDHLRLREYLGQDDDTTCSRYQRDEVKVVYPIVHPQGRDTSDQRERHEHTAWWRAKELSDDSYLDILPGIARFLRTTGPVVPKWGWTSTG